ncbi:MAG: hypothetical protein GY869_13535, partial [Planctomycetes bacterium]|nr:hypothetical protein [Planctomycetota bacterium]
MRLKILFTLAILASFILALNDESWSDEENYKFERMWPTLPQPWYFYEVRGIAIDNSGNVYIVDGSHDRIQKFNANGAFITKWGREGSGNGQFDGPKGVALDRSGDVYVVDVHNHRIQKFSATGEFIATWGSEGAGDGQFSVPSHIALDSSGNIYVADSGNDRIQKFSSNGVFLVKWGSEGDGNGQFDFPNGIAVDSNDNVYVGDYINHRVQKFSATGAFIAKWGGYGNGDGQFLYPEGITVDGNGYVLVADTINNRIQIFNANGDFIAKWDSEGAGAGAFDYPKDIAIDETGAIYFTDPGFFGIHKFSATGNPISRWSSQGEENGQFDWPKGIALDSNGNVYVADKGANRIQKFNSAGNFVAKWGGEGDGDGQFVDPVDVAVDYRGNVYVTDYGNMRIQKFNANGDFITKWGGEGCGDGQFRRPHGIAVDSSGNVYVADTSCHVIQKFGANGDFIESWGGYGVFDAPADISVDSRGNVYVVDADDHNVRKLTSNGDLIIEWGGKGSGVGQFSSPTNITVDNSDNVYIADTWNHRIQKFNPSGEYLTKFGGMGSEAGLLYRPGGIAVDPSGKIYVADGMNNRIQVYHTANDSVQSKAIIVAGGGPYPGNTLWDATQLCANFAYRALAYQGYNKDAIYYLSADTDLDLDGNGILDDVDADATNSNLQYAIETWARDAEDLFIYITDHGGFESFRMGEFETLEATVLDGWLDNLQATMDGPVTLLYDACRSGSFLDALAPPEGKQRIIATSASADQEALFGGRGSISFSYIFWSRMLLGDSFYDAYTNAKNSIALSYTQNSQLEADGNGVPNERADKEIAQAMKIGNETVTAADMPGIEEVSPARVLAGDTSALIYADNVIDADGISRVWAVITPPKYFSASPDDPVLDLPILELPHAGDNRYEGIYTGFDKQGDYNIAIFAADNSTLRTQSLPITTAVTQNLGQGAAEITPNIQANGSDTAIIATEGSPVSITLSMASGNNAGQNADWWILELTPEQTWNYFDLNGLSFTPGVQTTAEGPLVDFPNVQILHLTGLSLGNHV